jgi:hypothetical protein
LPYLRSHQLPSLSELNRIENTAIYEVGGLIGEFIIETWGRDALLTLVRAGGALETTLGVDETRFASRWLEYLQASYGI